MRAGANGAVRSIILTGAGSLDVAIAAIRAGAFDYISKPVDGDALALAASRALDHVSAPAACLLMRYDWPGNVRELENCIERAVALCRLDEITVEDLPRKIQTHGNELAVAIGSPRELITLDEMERRYIRHVLELLRGNKTRAVRTLGIDRRSLYRRLEAFETPSPIAPPDAGDASAETDAT